jgi:hypothetical protein
MGPWPILRVAVLSCAGATRARAGLGAARPRAIFAVLTHAVAVGDHGDIGAALTSLDGCAERFAGFAGPSSAEVGWCRLHGARLALEARCWGEARLMAAEALAIFEELSTTSRDAWRARVVAVCAEGDGVSLAAARELLAGVEASLGREHPVSVEASAAVARFSNIGVDFAAAVTRAERVLGTEHPETDKLRVEAAVVVGGPSPVEAIGRLARGLSPTHPWWRNVEGPGSR